MITLKNEVSNFNRKADAKINLLKEIIDRVQQGETVDVEGLLGSGNKVKEQEWAGGMLTISVLPYVRRLKYKSDCMLKPQSFI